MAEKKAFLLRLDPAVHDAMQRWAADELRSLNAHIEFLLRKSLRDAHRTPTPTQPIEPSPAADGAPSSDDGTS